MKNKMSVFTWSYRPRYYLLRPWKWFNELYWNCRNFIHRGKYGFAYVDVWGMDEYLLMLIPDMLRYLAEHSHGYPGVEPFETPEKYERFLINLAEKFESCQNNGDDWDSKNEYASSFFKQSDEICKRLTGDKDYDMAKEMTPEEQEVRNKYFSRMRELYKENDERVVEAYKELAENHNILWD